jgi:hypothetical protein
MIYLLFQINHKMSNSQLEQVKADLQYYTDMLKRLKKEGPFLYTRYVDSKTEGPGEITLWIDQQYLDLARKGLKTELKKYMSEEEANKLLEAAPEIKLNIPPLE